MGEPGAPAKWPFVVAGTGRTECHGDALAVLMTVSTVYGAEVAGPDGRPSLSGALLATFRKGRYNNAIRHFMWQASLTFSFGARAAKRLGDAHEWGESGPDTRIDQHNNSVARSYLCTSEGENPLNTAHSPRRGLFLGLAVTIGCLTGLALLAGSAYLLFYGSEGSCEEKQAVARMAEVSTAAPAAATGTTLVPERTSVECMDDSGDPWVAADSAYAYDTDAPSLATRYWDTAGEEGWKAVGGRAKAPDRFRSGFGMCFQKEVAGEPAQLMVRADGPGRFVVTVSSALDGSEISC